MTSPRDIFSSSAPSSQRSPLATEVMQPGVPTPLLPGDYPTPEASAVTATPVTATPITPVFAHSEVLDPSAGAGESNPRNAVLEAVVMANGNVPLAAERLHMPAEDVMLQVATHDTQFAGLIRGRALVTAWRIMEELALTVETSLVDMDPKDAVKAFTTLVTAMPTLLSEKRSGNTTIVEGDVIQQTINRFNPETARDKLLDNILRAASATGDGSGGGRGSAGSGAPEGAVGSTPPTEEPAPPGDDRDHSSPAAGDSTGADV